MAAGCQCDKEAVTVQRNEIKSNAALNGFIIWLRVLLVSIGALLLARAILLLSYPSYFGGLRFGELAAAFAVGLRFDAATAFLTITLPLLPLWIPLPSRPNGAARKISFWLACLFLITSAAFVWSDILFYGESGRHITIEPAGILNDMQPMLKLVFREYLFELFGLILFCAATVLALRWAYRYSSRAGSDRWWRYPILWILVGAISFTGVRGGWGKEPLKSSDALLAGSEASGSLALNGWYSFLYSAFNKQRQLPEYMNAVEAIRITQNLVAANGEVFVAERAPLLRQSIPRHSLADSAHPLNVVLIVVESLNASYLKSFGGSECVMPFLDSLAQQSLIFTNCSAFGTRSFRGLCAITASIPNLGPNPYDITLTLPKLRGLGEIFREQGYNTRFMHAAAPGSMGVQAICGMAGYKDFITADDFSQNEQNGSWGVWDHLALARMSSDLSHLREPFHYGLFTLCTHAPWTLPKGFLSWVGASVPDAPRLRTFDYLDQSLQRFFAHEHESGRAQRTLYVIVGDHTSHAPENERFRVACIFYAPGRLSPEVHNDPVGHLNILPTILDLCGTETMHASFGRSMLDPDTAARFVVTDQSNLYGWQRSGYRLLCNTDKLVALNDVFSSDKENFLATEPQLAESLRREFYAFYQTADELLRENRIVLRDE